MTRIVSALSRFAGSLAGRISLFLTIGISVAVIGALFVADHASRAELDRVRVERATASALDVLRRLAHDPAGAEREIRTRRFVGAHIIDADTARVATPNPALSADLSRRAGRPTVMADLPVSACTRGDPFWYRPRAAGFTMPAEPECWLLRVDRPGGPLLVSIDLARVIAPPSSLTQPILLIAVVLASALLSVIVAALALAPLRRLSAASHAFARSIDAEPLEATGPSDVRDALTTFNAMQERVREGVRERTRLLAAISHDLQTPLTRLRLRLEQVRDETLREKLIADLTATLTMVKRGLDLARSGESAEEWSTVDLDSMLAALAEDREDVGQRVQFIGGCGARVRVKPDALLRCMGNLVDNAVKYGGGATLSCFTRDRQTIISVRDYGPGMSTALIERAFHPFVRGAQDSDGTGIGLAIAKAQAETNGGRLELRNHKDGGLVAELILPSHHGR